MLYELKTMSDFLFPFIYIEKNNILNMEDGAFWVSALTPHMV